MAANYRGPYFRTGVDAEGNYWELATGSSPAFQAQRRYLARRPAGWELQKAAQVLPVHSSSISSSQEMSRIRHDLATGSEFPKETLMKKEYLKDMLVEIWKEAEPSVPAIPAYAARTNEPPVQAAETNGLAQPENPNVDDMDIPHLSEGQEVTKVASHGQVHGELLEATSKNSAFLNPNALEENAGIFEFNGQIDLSSASEACAASELRPQTYVSSRAAKRRNYESFSRMAYDPPKTPPPVVPSLEARSSASYVVLRGQRSTAKKRSKKSKLNAENAATVMDPPGQNQFTPGQPQFLSYLVPQLAAFRPPSRLPRSKVNGPSLQQSLEESLRSTMIVKRVPLVDGILNDRMLPPTMSPDQVPTARIPKKRFDAWGPLNWTQRQQRDLAREYIRQYQEGNPLQAEAKVKGQVDAQPPVTAGRGRSKKFSHQ